MPLLHPQPHLMVAVTLVGVHYIYENLTGQKKIKILNLDEIPILCLQMVRAEKAFGFLGSYGQ